MMIRNYIIRIEFLDKKCSLKGLYYLSSFDLLI